MGTGRALVGVGFGLGLEMPKRTKIRHGGHAQAGLPSPLQRDALQGEMPQAPSFLGWHLTFLT